MKKIKAKKIYIAMTTAHGDIWEIGAFPAVEPARDCCEADWNHLTTKEREGRSWWIECFDLPFNPVNQRHFRGWIDFCREHDQLITEDWNPAA